jgi:hypothetical protein
MRLFSFLGLLSVFIMAILNDFENNLGWFIYLFFTRERNMAIEINISITYI